MKRSIFFLITAILGGLFGGMMLLIPEKASEGFGLASTAETALLMRSIGGMIFSSAILNFLVRQHGDSKSLVAILIFNIIVHGLGVLIDIIGLTQGILILNKIIAGQLVHLFVIIGSFFYLMKIKSPST